MKSAFGFWLVIVCIVFGMMIAGAAEAMTTIGVREAVVLLAGVLGMVAAGSLAVVLLYDSDSDKL